MAAHPNAEATGGAITHLRTAHAEHVDPDLDAALRTEAVPNGSLAAVRQDLFGTMRDEGVHFGPKRGRQHPARPYRAIPVSGSSPVSG